MLNALIFKPKLLKIGGLESLSAPSLIASETINDELDEFYRIINCDTIDIVKRKIGGRYYCIICDDEALLKPNPIMSIAGIKDPNASVFGNVIIVGEENENGELTDLTENDIKNIRSNVITTFTKHDNHPYMLALIRTY